MGFLDFNLILKQLFFEEMIRVVYLRGGVQWSVGSGSGSVQLAVGSGR